MYCKVVEFDINNWKHMQNDTEMSTLFYVHYAPYEAEKIIRQVYTSTTVPHARDLQISIFRNNFLTRKNLYNKNLVPTVLNMKKHYTTGLSHAEQANQSGTL